MDMGWEWLSTILFLCFYCSLSLFSPSVHLSKYLFLGHTPSITLSAHLPSLFHPLLPLSLLSLYTVYILSKILYRRAAEFREVSMLLPLIDFEERLLSRYWPVVHTCPVVTRETWCQTLIGNWQGTLYCRPCLGHGSHGALLLSATTMTFRNVSLFRQFVPSCNIITVYTGLDLDTPRFSVHLDLPQSIKLHFSDFYIFRMEVSP